MKYIYYRSVQQTDSERDMKGKQTIQSILFLIELCTHNTQHFSINYAVHLIVTIICWYKMLIFSIFKVLFFFSAILMIFVHTLYTDAKFWSYYQIANICKNEYTIIIVTLITYYV